MLFEELIDAESIGFMVRHKEKNTELWVYNETEKGFLHISFNAFTGFTGAAYLLKKPKWERVE